MLFRSNQPRLGRCYDLGKAIRRAIAGWDSDKRVALIASGGLSHVVIEENIDDEIIVGLKEKDKERLTGMHETSPIHAFRYGQFDRGASVRIPMVTVNAGKGYFEDRRPAANMDPYQVCAILIETVCGS